MRLAKVTAETVVLVGSLFSIVGGAVMAFLAFIGSPYARPALYGVATTSALLAVCVMLLAYRAAQKFEEMFREDRQERLDAAERARAEQVTPENIEAKIGEWLHEAEFHVTHLPLSPESPSIFEYSITSSSSYPPTVVLIVAQAKEMPRYILLHTVITLDAPQKALYYAARPQQKRRLLTNLRLELSRCHMQCQADLPDTVEVHRQVPIDTNLTDMVFLERVDQFMADVMAVHDTLILELDELSDENAGGTDSPAPAPREQ